MRRVLLPSLLIASACGSDATNANSSGDAATGSTTAHSDTTLATATSAATSDASGSTSTGDNQSTGASSSSSGSAPTPALCEAIDISLVLGRQAPIYGIEKRRAVANFLDTLTERTGARIRVFPNTGATAPPPFDCTLDADGPADGATFLWGEHGVPKLSARPKLDCVYKGVKDSPSAGDADGDWMFSGLMFPILEHDDWPTKERSVAISMMLAKTDDAEGGMYARPGMASEAYLRLAADGDRDRALSFTIGTDADELETFSASVSAGSLHLDWDTHDLTEGLESWVEVAVDACANAEEPDVPQPPGGCEHIDVLFVVDGSLSMEQEQDALRGIGGPPVFADFTDALTVSLDTLEDIRVGVISAEPGDTALHTHRDQPAMLPGPATDCGMDVNEPWLTVPSPDLQTRFACVAATDATSTLESTSRNAADALLDPANAGFLREDSLVFVVMLTDEDTLGLGATRMQVRAKLLEAVGGDLSRLVVLAIAGDQGVFEAPKTTCQGTYGTATPGRRLTSVVRSFREQGITADICEGDLAQTFDDALGALVQACVSFQPEG